jgi:hypothetical protein
MKRLVAGLLVLGVLVSIGAALAGRLNELLPLDVPTSAATQRSVTAPVRLIAAAEQDASAAIQQVIQRSNDEQAQALAARDPSVMSDTATSERFQQLVQINQDLIDNGVIHIELVKLEWGAVAITGSTATATTYETWTTTLADGTVAQSRDRNDYGLVLDNGAWKIKTTDHPDQARASGRPAPSGASPPPQTQPFPLPENQNTSHNWAGYAATGGTFTSVAGTWTVPQFNADGALGIDAAWVGIGGVRSRDLIQAGTQQTVSGSGSTQYQAWVETLPRASQPVPLRIHAGDSVTVSLSEQSTDQWLIEFINNTTGQTYQQTQHYTSSRSSAEWVEEAPSSARGGVLPLSNFGTIEFSAGSAVKDGQTVSIAAANAKAITMISSNEQALAVPSPLGSDGSSFSVARTDVPATAASPVNRRGRRGP